MARSFWNTTARIEARRSSFNRANGTIILEHDRIVAADLRESDASLVGPIEDNPNRSASSPVVSDVTGHKRILEDFRKAIETDGTPLCDGREGRRSVELVEAVYESSRTGQPVSLRSRTDQI